MNKTYYDNHLLRRGRGTHRPRPQQWPLLSRQRRWWRRASCLSLQLRIMCRLNDSLVLWYLTPVGCSLYLWWLVPRTVSLAVVPGGGRVGGVVELLCPGHLDPRAAPGQTSHLVGGGAGGVGHTLQLQDRVRAGVCNLTQGKS